MNPAQILRDRSPLRPRLGLVLGSGFGGVAGEVTEPVSVPFAELPGFPHPSVPGHAGRVILGRLGGTPVVVVAGRGHYYEGLALDEVTRPVRVLAEFGIRALLLTNAAGGIRDDLGPGTLVCLTDHLNFLGANPLRGPGGAERFVDLSEAYDPGLRVRLKQASADASVPLRHGVYAAVAGPSYETPAEVRALRTLGADLVGMSTVPEVIVARQCGLAVAALSCVTNRAAGLGGAISHAEVLSTGREVAGAAARLIKAFARRCGETLN